MRPRDQVIALWTDKPVAENLRTAQISGHSRFPVCNGSLDDIAGVSNEAGNVVGLMPHPEHAVEAGFGPDMPEAMRSGVDGLKFFTSVINALVNA